ncbi:hypothetical protein MKW98_028522 [Papaver atlanticum]|uniref:RNA polymerase II C-terminal domain phosphatase-like n=1 Tax=Papaver atlanticum TaxID=357466 RepID=A0AAD4XUT9_9MAGN|nr:hypothetical protein MKW98_028522 [Papaver atlanticum]
MGIRERQKGAESAFVESGIIQRLLQFPHPVEYIDKSLKDRNLEYNLLHGRDMKSELLRNKKLCLVLDLDHTLLHSVSIRSVPSNEQEYLDGKARVISSMHDKQNLYRLIGRYIKLRPFIRTFLKQASSMFELYVYTMAPYGYAIDMARLLNPENVFFNYSKVLSRDECTKMGQKSLDVVLGGDDCNAIVIDDTESVWRKHNENLILMDQYNYFTSGHKLKMDDEISYEFSTTDENFKAGDVREVLQATRKEVLEGCNLLFIYSSALETGNTVTDNQKLLEMAQKLGATCCTDLDACVTHIISTDIGTGVYHWAMKYHNFFVHPRWIVTSNFLWELVTLGGL